jgi:hypothetical protein
MAKEKVIIGCRLPHGLVLEHPLQKDVKATLAGVHSSKIIGATFVITEVDSELWELWKSTHATFQPLTSGAIFEARNESEAAGKGKEMKKEKTGFEPMPQESLGVKSSDKK